MELFFYSSKDKLYLEVEFGPHGQHLGLLLKQPVHNCILHSFPIDYEVQISKPFFTLFCSSRTELFLVSRQNNRVIMANCKQIHFSFQDKAKKTWIGHAKLPKDYFPPNVDKFNAYAIHGLDGNRCYKSLFPVPGSSPDFHRLECFQSMPLQLNDEISDMWKNALAKAADP